MSQEQPRQELPSTATLAVGDQLPTREHVATNVSLFLYNAAVWNPHRIHYDEPYTTQVEGHAGVVIDGPLQGDWITQVVLNWLGAAGELKEFSYSNRQAAHLGDTLRSTGKITAIDPTTRTVELDVWISNEAGEAITPGTAVVVLNS